MTEDNMESQQNEFGNLVLPENGVTDLTDKLTEYMTGRWNARGFAR